MLSISSNGVEDEIHVTHKIFESGCSVIHDLLGPEGPDVLKIDGERDSGLKTKTPEPLHGARSANLAEMIETAICTGEPQADQRIPFDPHKRPHLGL